MIRVNLLAPDRPTQKKKATASSSPSSGGGSFQPIVLIGGFLALAVLVCAAGWYQMTSRIQRLDTRIATAQENQRRLQAIKAQVEQFERKKIQLEIRKLLIEKLRAEQRGPVHMLDELSKALPDYVWLVSMDQAGGGVKLKGQAASLAAVADFIAALQRSGWFTGMDLIASSTDPGGSVGYDLGGSFVNPEAEAKAKELAAKMAAIKPPATTKPGARPGGR